MGISGCVCFEMMVIMRNATQLYPSRSSRAVLVVQIQTSSVQELKRSASMIVKVLRPTGTPGPAAGQPHPFDQIHDVDNRT